MMPYVVVPEFAPFSLNHPFQKAHLLPTTYPLLTASDGVGQRHTFLCDFISLQAVTPGSLLPAISSIYGQAAIRAMAHPWVCHQLMGGFIVPAALPMLACSNKLVREPSN
jgi:hypothetical protein